MLRTLKPKPAVSSDDTPLIVPQTLSSLVDRSGTAPSAGPVSKTFHLLPCKPRTIRKLNKVKASKIMLPEPTSKGPESSGTGGATAKTYTFEPSQQKSVIATTPWSAVYPATNELFTTESEINGNTDIEEEDSEQQWRAHLMEMHDGRDPCGMTCKPYFDVRLPPP